MKYLVTGAAGFIGSSIVDKLLENGHSVVGIDNLSTGLIEFLVSAKKNNKFTFIQGDLLYQVDLLKDALNEVDTVFHMSANADIRGGLAQPRRDLEQNTLVTFNVLEAMRHSKVRRIVFASTAAALGEPSIFPTPENCPIPAQTSLYGASKMACEGLISSYCEGFGFESFVFRFVSLLGPRYPHGHVFDFVSSLMRDSSKLTILGDGQQRKSYLHIDDCVSALLLISNMASSKTNSHSRFNVYHLGMPEYCLVEQSANWICDELGVNPKFNFLGGERGWVGDNPFVFLDVSKAMSTGWSPKYGIEESVRATVRWLVSNQWIFSKRSYK
jgi:UDP-glucose 4-epimerase